MKMAMLTVFSRVNQEIFSLETKNNIEHILKEYVLIIYSICQRTQISCDVRCMM